MIIVTRNDHDYGPYDEYTLARFVEEGKLLMNDKARDADTGQQDTIKTFLDRAGIHPRVKHRHRIHLTARRHPSARLLAG